MWSDSSSKFNQTEFSNDTDGVTIENMNINPERDMYLGVYGGLGFGQVMTDHGGLCCAFVFFVTIELKNRSRDYMIYKNFKGLQDESCLKIHFFSDDHRCFRLVVLVPLHSFGMNQLQFILCRDQ